MSLPHLKRPSANSLHSAKPPLLVLLHGYGSNEADLFSFADMLDERFLVLSPRAPQTLGQGGYAWFDVSFTPDGALARSPEQMLASRNQLSAFIREAVTTYAADPEQIYLLGFSQGAMMSALVALTEPSLIAGAVMMSGRIPDEIQHMAVPSDQLATLRLFVGHGTADNVISVAEGRATAALLNSLHVAHEYHEYPIGHHFSDESLDDILGWLGERIR
jgi:phospholipase/carboxylesterase